MKIIFFSANMDMIDEWKSKHTLDNSFSCYDEKSLQKVLKGLLKPAIIIADFDSVATQINKLISSNELPQNTVVLEKTPEITAGKLLISRGVKAYANSRISDVNFLQMINAVSDGKVWTYPALTAALVQSSSTPTLNEDAKSLIQNRLSPKELEVAYLVLEGLTNDTIATKLDITTRTVKAHVSSIFSKLHVSDRISLVLLLK